MGLARGIAFEDRPYKGDVPPTRTIDWSRWKNIGTWNTVTATRLPGKLWVASLTGAATSYIDVGDINRYIQGVGVWLYPDSIVSKSFMDLDGGTHSLETDGSGDVTATGWATPTFYVNGVAATRLTASAWNFVFVTTATPFLASNFDIGREAAAYWDGLIALTTLFGYVPSAGQIFNRLNKQLRYFGVG